MGGRASIVGAAETNVGKVRDHNEDCHFIDSDLGIFLVCDGMGGHAAGEVASALAIKTIREQWSSNATQTVVDRWLAAGTHEARRTLLGVVQKGVHAAHDAILSEAHRDRTKGGMGTTLVGALLVGGDIVFAHCGDSRAYLVRDGIAMQLTEDHTLLARLLAAGVDVDVSGDGARFKSMLTNALGIGPECKVSTFVVPVADGDRFLLCSDGVTEYVQEAEIGEVLCKMPSPARAAQKLVEMALDRGGGDNATAVVVRVLEAGETSRPAEEIHRDEKAIFACPLWKDVTPQQRLRALRIAIPRDHGARERIPAHTLGDRVAWIIVEGEVEQDGETRGPGTLLYPEALLADRPLPDKDGLAIPTSELRALAIRADDFGEVCEDDPELGEVLLAALGTELSKRRPGRRTGRVAAQEADGVSGTDPGLPALPLDDPPIPPPKPAPARTDYDPQAARMAFARTVPGEDVPADADDDDDDDDDTSLERPPQKKPALRAATNRELIVKKEDRAATDAAFDNAMANIADGHAPAKPTAAEPEADDGDGDDDDEPEHVIEVEADAPEPHAKATEVKRPSRPVLGDHSDAEISIEAMAELPEEDSKSNRAK